MTSEIFLRKRRPREALRVVAFWCWYRGALFRGYQQQEGLRTVQGELLAAFARAGLSRNPVVAGRTDRGVDARMQVLSGRVDEALSTTEIHQRLAAELPDDLGVHLVRETRDGFHAAWSANSKEYRYVIPREAVGDLSVLRAAAAVIPGERNFRVFHFKTSAEKPRTVHSVELTPADDGTVTARFLGGGFARYMVRMLVGGMTAVARGEVPMAAFQAGLEQQVNFHCPKAPAEPLTLWDVGYPKDVDPFLPEERRAFPWPSG